MKFTPAPVALALLVGLAGCAASAPSTGAASTHPATSKPSSTSSGAASQATTYDTSTWLLATSNGGENPSTTLSRYSVSGGTVTPLAEVNRVPDYNVVSGDGKYVIIDDSIENTSIGVLRLGDTRSDLAPLDVLSIPGFGSTSKVHDIFFRPTAPHTLQVNVQLDGEKNTMTEVGTDPTATAPKWDTLKTITGPAWKEGSVVDFSVDDGTGNGDWRVTHWGADGAEVVDHEVATDTPHPWAPTPSVELMLPGEVNQGDMHHEAVNDGTVWRFQNRTDGDAATMYVSKRKTDADHWTNVGAAVRGLPGDIDWARPIG